MGTSFMLFIWKSALVAALALSSLSFAGSDAQQYSATEPVSQVKRQEGQKLEQAAPGEQPQSLAAGEALESAPSIEVVATGYTAGVESTGKQPGHPQYGVTYSGVKVRRDQVSTIAADPAFFPIGTLLFIPGYGYGVVADTGSAIKGRRIDLYFETIKEVYKQWGKRKVEVQVLRWGSGKLTQSWLNEINRAVEVGKPIPQYYLES